MSYKTVLAYLGSAGRAPIVLDAAMRLAAKFDAHMIALTVIPQVSVPAIVPFEVTGDIMEAQQQILEKEADAIAAVYKKAIAGTVLQHEWRLVRASHYDLAASVDAHARSVDLIVAAQSDPAGTAYSPSDVTEDLMMEAGRPILVVPGRTKAKTIGDRVLVAWNDSREASRAAFDAIPFMQQAREVRLLTLDTRLKSADATDVPAAGIAVALARHGIKPDTAVAEGVAGGTFADSLLAEIERFRADLVVMGGYGHSRLRELVFGGATHDMLSRMPVPVLMSH